MGPERWIIGLFGATGTGKTQAARVLARPFRRRIYLDVREDYDDGDEGSGADAEHLATDRDDAVAYLRGTKHDEDFSLIYRPPVDEPEPEAAAFLCGLAWAHRHTLVVLDEAHRSCPQHEVHPHTLACVLRGRTRGISMMFVSQRPAHLHTDIQAECFSNTVYLFRLRRKADTANIMTEFGSDLAHSVAGLPRLECVRVTEEGLLEPLRVSFDRGRPILVRADQNSSGAAHEGSSRG